MRKTLRLVLLVGAVAWLLLESRRREVVLVYDVSAVPGATALEVELRSGTTLVRRAHLALRPGEQVRHLVRLRDGTYALAWRALGGDAPAAGSRDLAVAGDQTIVLPLAP